jgi:hypothetical protein
VAFLRQSDGAPGGKPCHPSEYRGGARTLRLGIISRVGLADLTELDRIQPRHTLQYHLVIRRRETLAKVSGEWDDLGPRRRGQKNTYLGAATSSVVTGISCISPSHLRRQRAPPIRLCAKCRRKRQLGGHGSAQTTITFRREIEGTRCFASLRRPSLKVLVKHLFSTRRVNGGGVRDRAVEVEQDGVVLIPTDGAFAQAAASFALLSFSSSPSLLLCRLSR